MNEKYAWTGCAVAALACHPVPATAAVAAGGADGVGLSGGGLLQVMLGLGLVLAVLALCAWLLKRFHGAPRHAGGTVRIIGGAAVGQRERVVVVEVSDTWLVIGVAPGQVTALHSMPRGSGSGFPDAMASAAGRAEAGIRFPTWPGRPKAESTEAHRGG